MQREGGGKQWYGIPGSKAKAFRSTMEKLMKLRIKEVPDLEHHITTQISPSTLLRNNVPVYKVIQEAGQFIVTFPEAYHCGFSYGFNCGEAVNFATSDWIPHGSQSVVDYRLKGKKEVFSFDRLLFTLTYHLKSLSLESCRMLLHELRVLQKEEQHFRALLYVGKSSSRPSIAARPPPFPKSYHPPLQRKILKNRIFYY